MSSASFVIFRVETRYLFLDFSTSLSISIRFLSSSAFFLFSSSSIFCCSASLRFISSSLRLSSASFACNWAIFSALLLPFDVVLPLSWQFQQVLLFLLPQCVSVLLQLPFVQLIRLLFEALIFSVLLRLY